jgi:alpha-galactosidase
MLDIVDMQVGLEGAAGPGHWNDPDMLEVGNGGMTTLEYRSHFSLWAMLAAPLIAGNDLRSMSPEIKAILTNKEVIAINQDPLGSQGRRVRKDGDKEIWVKQLKDGSRAVILFNRSAAETEISMNWTDLGYPEHLSASVRDLWAGKDLRQVFGEGGFPRDGSAAGDALTGHTPRKKWFKAGCQLGKRDLVGSDAGRSVYTGYPTSSIVKEQSPVKRAGERGPAASEPRI